ECSAPTARLLRWFFIVTAAVQLSACGGGGGGSDRPAPTPGVDGLPIPGQGTGAPLPAGFFRIGGTIEGLEGELQLIERSGDKLTRSENGPFEFEAGVQAGKPYEVQVAVPPAGQSCSVENGAGTVDNAKITSVRI